MNFLHSHKHARLHAGGIGTAVLFFGALAFVQYAAPNLFSAVAARIAFPLLSARAAFRGAWSSGDQRQAEVERLRSENKSLKTLTQASVNAEDLRAETEHGLIAHVLARPRWSVYDTLFLGAGETHGITAGMRVLAYGFVIGEIAETYADSSLAVLYSSPGKKVLAQLSNAMPVELSGTGGGSFETSVAEGALVRAGDGAFAPGLSPRLFAVVDAVEEEIEGILKVYLRLPVNIFELQVVEIIRTNGL